MTITKEELDFIIRGLDIQELRYLDDHHIYKRDGNEPAAQDCLDHFHRVYQLRQKLIEFSHDCGTEIALI